jgi:hypothetical protein
MLTKKCEFVPLTKEGVGRYVNRISDALNGSYMNGFEERFLIDMLDKFNSCSINTRLSSKQWAFIERILWRNEGRLV